MKKKLTAIALIVALFSLLIVGGTFSFFKDTEKATNVLTMGDIDIMLRECNGDRNQTNDEYLTWLDGQILEPSINIEKEVWVENIGDNDAYVRVFVVWPKAMTPMLSLTWAADLGDNWAAESVNYTIGGVEYTGHCLVYKANEGVLKAGKITADTLTDVKLLSAVECEVVGENTVYTIIADGVKHTYTTNTADFPVLVCAQAGQTTNEEGNWKTATEALNYMFGNPADAATNPWAEYDVWDSTADTTWFDTAKTEFEISSAEQLAGLSAIVYSGNNMNGKTIKLTGDIDLAGIDWQPIGRMINTSGVGENSTFKGNFDGQGYTIYNLSVNTADEIPDTNKGGALFGAISGSITNLNIVNADIVTNHWAGVLAGSLEDGVISNCSVTNATVTCLPEKIGAGYDNGDKAGAIAGYISNGASVDGCVVKNVTVTAYRDLGGIVGAAHGTVSNNLVADLTVKQVLENGYEGTPTTVGAYVGRTFTDTVMTNNNGTVTIIK